tara:strand:- start:161 stop:1426 length:1266 start_codon:yes stop_codon:yes gene_type:complete
MKKFLDYSKVKYLLPIIIIILSFYRSPYIFLNGRFVSEEGNQYFVYVWENGFWKSLLYLQTEAGYFNFIANLLVSLSSLMQIEFSPMVTVYGSLVFILLPSYLILFRNSLLFDTDSKKIIGSFLLFITTPFVPEIWVNSINAQVYLCINSMIILFMININNFQKKINHIIIFISAFSGVYTCCLLPLFAINYYLKKNFYNLLNFLILIGASILQFYFVVYSKINNLLPSYVLAADLDLNLMVNYIYNILLKPIFGRQIIHFVWNNINYLFLLIGIFILLLSIIIYNYKKLKNFILKDRVLLYLIYIFFTISFLVLIGAAGNYVGGRYAAIPGATLLLIILHSIYKININKIRIIFIILITFSLISGVYEFRPPKNNVNHQYIKYLDCIDCPDWKKEIKKWRINNNHSIGIWPYPKKNMRLK